MVKVLYCWRCKMDIPMLEEHEWHEVMSVGKKIGLSRALQGPMRCGVITS
jgi:hypothetical protein